MTARCCGLVYSRPLLLRVVGLLPGARDVATNRDRLRAGVAQASREETAEYAEAVVEAYGTMAN
jgi:hypothetical protein